MDLKNRLGLTLVLLLTLAGEAVRVRQFVSCPAFWEDEIAVLLNTRHQSMAQLPFVHLTAYSKESPVAAPPVFLWATKWMGDRFNYAEWSVRVLPFACSLAAMLLFAHLAWRMLTPIGAAWAVALFAFSDPLIFQAADVKPYSGDVLISVLVIWIAFAFKPKAPAAWRLIGAALVTVFGIWISYSVVFVLAAVGLALWGQLDKNRRRGFAKMLLCVAPAVASFLVVYFLSIRRQRDVNLDVYWVHLFPNWLRPWTVPGYTIGGTWELFHYMMYPIGPVMLIAAAIGIAKLRRERNTALLILLLAPVGLDFLAACLAQYPFGGTRLTLYLQPFLCFLCGIGADATNRWIKLALASVPVSAAALAIYGLFVPQNKGNLRDALQFLNSHRQLTEPVHLLGNQTLGAAKWYWPHPDDLTHLHFEQSAKIHGDGFWVVVCYEPRKRGENEIAMKQPDAVVDESRSLHINGADVLWFAPKQGTSR